MKRQIKSAHFTKVHSLSKSKKLKTLKNLPKGKENLVKVVRLILDQIRQIQKKKKVSSRVGGKNFYTCNRMLRFKALYQSSKSEIIARLN